MYVCMYVCMYISFPSSSLTSYRLNRHSETQFFCIERLTFRCFFFALVAASSSPSSNGSWT
jgi:hypothetical protein